MLERPLALAGVLASLIVVSAGASGCLPSRDNPNDPARAPIAKLAVLSSNGGAATGGRATLFRVDASGSYDPFGGKPVAIDFDLDDDPSTFETPGPTCASRTATDCFVMRTLPMPADAVFDAGVGGGVRVVRVRVTSATGHRSYASATVAILNRAPVVDLGPDLFVSDVVGTPTRLDPCGPKATCRSSDPDGDALGWSWAQLRGDPVTLASAGSSGVVTFDAPARTQELLFRATADDGIAQRSADVHVFVGPRVVVRSLTPPRTFAFHEDFPTRALVTPEAARIVSTDRLTGDVFVEMNDGVNVEQVVHLTSDPAEIERWTYSNNDVQTASSIAPTGDGGVCLAAVAPTSMTNTFVRLRTGFPAPVSRPLAAREGARLVFPKRDQPGACWALSSTQPYVLAPDGSSLTPVGGTAPYKRLEAGAQDAADGSLWIADCPSGDTPCSTPSVLRHWAGSGLGQQVATFPFDVLQVEPDQSGGAFVWSYASANTTYQQNATHVLADGSVIPLDLGLDVDGLFGVTSLAYDPIEKALWVRDYFSKTDLVQLLDLGDTMVRELTVTPDVVGASQFDEMVSLSLDATSGRAFVLAGPPRAATTLAAVPVHGRRVDLLPSPGAGSLVAPMRDGSYWTAAFDPLGTSAVAPDAARVDDEGDVLATWTSPATVLHDLVATSTGEAAFAIETASHGGLIQRIAANGAPTGATISSTTPFDRLAEDAGADRICASRFSFATNASASPVRITSLASGSPQVTALAFTPGSTFHQLSGVYHDGSCWFFDATSNTLTPSHLLRFAPTGTAAALDLTSINGTAIRSGVGLAIDPRDGSAWVADGSTPRITRTSPTGTLIAAWTLPQPPTGGPDITVDLAVEERCANASDPRCLRVWWVTLDGTTGAMNLNAAPATTSTPIRDVRVPLASQEILPGIQRALWAIP